MNASGPRCLKDLCECGGSGFEAWPPKLEEGRDVTRWENSGAGSILYLPDLKGRLIGPSEVYGRQHRAIEMNEGHPNFREEFLVSFPDWRENIVVDVQSGVDAAGEPLYIQDVTPNDYSPSALQKFSLDGGFVKLSPTYTSRWKIIKKKEWPFELEGPDGIMNPKAEDVVAFLRTRKRPDHVDEFYNDSKVGTVGLHWE